MIYIAAPVSPKSQLSASSSYSPGCAGGLFAGRNKTGKGLGKDSRANTSSSPQASPGSDKISFNNRVDSPIALNPPKPLLAEADTLDLPQDEEDGLREGTAAAGYRGREPLDRGAA